MGSRRPSRSCLGETAAKGMLELSFSVELYKYYTLLYNSLAVQSIVWHCFFLFRPRY